MPFVAMCLLAVATSAPAQERERGFGEEIHVLEVNLEVVVTDRDGEFVRGLQADDFEITENGSPVEVIAATAYSSREAVAAPESGEVVAEERFIMVLFHAPIGAEAERIGFGQRSLRAGADLARWAKESLGPNDRVAVATYRSSLHLLQDFTQDQDALGAALRGAGMGLGATFQGPESKTGSTGLSLPRGQALTRQTKNVYEGIRVLARASSKIVGRKLLILLTPGLPDDRPQGYGRMMRALKSANVAVYPIDTTPLEWLHPQNVHVKMALDTGGQFSPRIDRFDNRVEDVVNGNAAYYSLAYQSPVSAFELGDRNLAIRVRGRQGYRVTLR